MTFKNLAKKAKNRLINAGITQEKTTSRALSVQTSYYINARTNKPEDDPLYGKVKKILDNDIDVISPIGKLIEREVYDGLNEYERDRYLLDLSKRYSAMKKQYEKEKNLALNPL